MLEAMTHSVLECSVSLKVSVDYDRNFENYRKFCISCQIPALPLTYRSIAMFMCWVVSVTGKATMIGAIASAINHKIGSMGLVPLTKRDQQRLKRLKQGLRKLAPHFKQQAAPLTIEVLVALTNKLSDNADLSIKLAARINNARAHHDPRAATRLAFLQWKARTFISHSAMLRASDHSFRERKAHNQMTKGCVQWRTNLLVLWVPPGKANADFEPTFHPLSSLDGCAAKYFLDYWHAFNFDDPEVKQDAYLWPLVHNGMIIRARPSPVTAFVKLTVYMLNLAGFPPSYTSQITGHSWRCGGCTDYLAADAPDSFVKLQGRWRSPCYHTYLRHSYCYGKQVSQRLFRLLRPACRDGSFKDFVPLTAHISDEGGI